MPTFSARSGQKIEMIFMGDEYEVIVRDADGEVISTTRINRLKAAEIMIQVTDQD